MLILFRRQDCTFLNFCAKKSKSAKNTPKSSLSMPKNHEKLQECIIFTVIAYKSVNGVQVSYILLRCTTPHRWQFRNSGLRMFQLLWKLLKYPIILAYFTISHLSWSDFSLFLTLFASFSRSWTIQTIRWQFISTYSTPVQCTAGGSNMS